MNTRHENGTLVIELVGKVDTTNASQVEAELIEDAAGATDAIIDASGLDYISSAGLRVLLKLRKRLGSLTVTETSPDVFEIFEVTGFTQLMDVRKRLREISVDGCDVIGKGGNGTVYRLDDDKIVKVYETQGKELVEQEQGFARTALVSGVPCVIPYDMVRCGDKYGVVFEMVRSDTLSNAILTNPERTDELVDQYVELAHTLHATHMPKGALPDVRNHMRTYANNLDRWCTDQEISEIVSIIDALPERDTILHNDLHPNNIMIQDDELLLIDLAEVSVGPRAIDLASIYRDMIAGAQSQPEITEANIGMPVGMVEQVGRLFFAKYTGITDPDALEAYLGQIGLIFAFNAVLLVGAGLGTTDSFAPHLMDKLLRPVVLPNKDAIIHLISTL